MYSDLGWLEGTIINNNNIQGTYYESGFTLSSKGNFELQLSESKLSFSGNIGTETWYEQRIDISSSITKCLIPTSSSSSVLGSWEFNSIFESSFDICSSGNTIVGSYERNNG